MSIRLVVAYTIVWSVGSMRSVGYGAPIPPAKPPSPEMFAFMRRFGYLDANPSDSEALYSEDAVIDAIKMLQKYGGIPQTGAVDDKTLKLMTSPRCGVRDLDGGSNTRSGWRRKRFVVGGRGWQKRQITYFIANWSAKLDEKEVTEDMGRAFELWGQYANLNFIQVFDPSADIVVGFGTYYHGDSYPFDGPGYILAHAFYPYEMGSYGGDIHFDSDENWTRSENITNGEINFLSVAVHELGHSLGLGHSPIYNSIMFPYYRPTHSTPITLDFDDILAMYNLYVRVHLPGDDEMAQTPPSFTTTDIIPTSTYETTIIPDTSPVIDSNDRENASFTTESISVEREERPTTLPENYFSFHGDYETVEQHKTRFSTTASLMTSERAAGTLVRELPPPPNLCEGNFDAVSLLRGEIFIFRGRFLWRLTNRFHILPGYPVDVAEVFPTQGTPSLHIDAAYERHTDGHIVLFSGNQYWLYNGSHFVDGSPRLLTDYGIDSQVTSIDAALVWGKNGRTYLFSGDIFWRYNEDTSTLDPGYPKSIARWHGISDNLDAATTLENGQSIFFRGDQVWLYNNFWIRPEIGYPKRIDSLLHCHTQSNHDALRMETIAYPW
ncbi:72 kDa type IV collagenase-like [Lutzomyia longipalpis]|uniref:72 kDa type IV collagenase-like n=1 Tax=Lutzomyia longipalpis TaxID=7200 RepID=UPI002483EE0B|nr:72 kDa type IV collagenase-like [Lutzomyia longipalpis]